ncbi:glutamate racemase [Treponema sp. C6A8]|uniref:glutamate racemase n=1 Tax=Treponema sp. C6A8 TaxID=1410609 RepID=UPI000684AFE7|nr:glutamate racemase [Treponema sp. C6A8]
MSVDFAFLDSGTGGIPYMNFLREKCPAASCVYVADNKNFPYGEKSAEQIVKSVLSICEKIISKFNPNTIVIACNTMSVNALDAVRKAFPEINFVGTVPAIKLAAGISKKRRIGLLATNSTVNHPYNKKLKADFASDCELICRGDADLISFVEHESFTSSKQEIMQAVKPAVDFFRSQDCDVIILGCTHFLNIASEIQEVCGTDIRVVDSKEGVVNHAIEVSGVLWGKHSVPLGEGVAENAGGGRSEGKAFPIPQLYITGFTEKKDENEYDVICKRFGLVFKNII